ncbi:MAG: alpha/beta fold hydrolase [Anaerolineae bacterium]
MIDRVVQVESQRLHVARQGQGPPVVFLHGWGASWHQWRLALPVVARSGFCGYAPDLPGHGDSAKPPDAQGYAVDACLAGVMRWLDAERLGRFLLVGHSLGGYLSLQLALRQPERLAGLVLVNPLYTPAQLRHSPLPQGDGPARLGAWFLEHLPEWLIHLGLALNRPEASRLPPDLRRQMARDFKRASPHIVRTISTCVDLRPDLPSIRTPALVIWGDRDATLNRTFYPALVETLPNASGLCLAGAGHSPHLWDNARFCELLLSFARRHLL